MKTFHTIELSKELLKALNELSFQEPTPIQAKTIPHLLNTKKDLIALAQTGTGKTAAFSIPIIQQLDQNSKSVQSLILCPTRELCMQTTKAIKSFLKYTEKINVTAIYGGANIDQQIRALKKGTQIVVGTPGRTIDLMKRKILKLNTIQYLVLDEADEMLDMGFKDELDTILEQTPREKQTLLFSATMPNSLLAIANQYMKNPDQISAGEKNRGAENVEHLYCMVHARDRYQALRRIADISPDIYGIVFCRTRRETQEVADKLIQDHYSAEPLHGDLSQSQRTNIMNRFRDKKVQILVATDVAARGIDVNDLTHVINYNLPDGPDTYIHRSGRTGRAQKNGTAISIINMKEMGKIRNIERKVGKEFLQAKIPKGEEICKNQLFSLINKIQTVQVEEEQINEYLPEINEKLKDLSREDLIKQFVSAEFNRFLSAYKNAPDLNISSQDRSKDRSKHERNKNVAFTTITLNIGKKNGFRLQNLFSLMNQHPRLRGIEIGNIDISNDHTTLEIDANRHKDVMTNLQKDHFKGKPILATGRGHKPKRSFAQRERGGSYKKSYGEKRNGYKKNKRR